MSLTPEYENLKDTFTIDSKLKGKVIIGALRGTHGVEIEFDDKTILVIEVSDYTLELDVELTPKQ